MKLMWSRAKNEDKLTLQKKKKREREKAWKPFLCNIY